MADKSSNLHDWKRIVWIGSARGDLRSFPRSARTIVGVAPVYAQAGSKHPDAKPMKGKLAGVMEISADTEGQAYRAAYVTKLGDVVYALHAFNKKSTKGAKTPKREQDIIEIRLKAAKKHYEKLSKK